MAGVQAGRLSIEIVAEVARLQQDLDRAKRAVAAASGDIARSAQHANDNLAGMGRAMGGVTRASGAMRANMINLSRQVTDVTQGFALGQAPMQIFLQQGFQIAEVLALMKMEARETGTSFTAMATRGLGRVLPLATRLVAVLGVIGLGMRGVTNEINRNSDVTVGWGDVVMGTYDAVAAAVDDSIGAAWRQFVSYFGTALDQITSNTARELNTIIGFFVAAANQAVIAWDALPSVFAELFVNVANAAIQSLEDMINGGIGLINRFSSMVNSVLGTGIGEISDVDIPSIENSWAGAGTAAGTAMAEASSSAYRDYLGAALEYVQPFIEARASAVDEAAETGSQAGRALGRAVGAAAAPEVATAIEDALKEAALAAAEAAEEVARKTEDASQNTQDKIKAEAQLRIDAAEDLAARERELAEERLADMANLYETLFTDGVDGVWDVFKKQGLAAISQIAAQWTLALLSGQSGSAGGNPMQAIASIFGGGAANDNGAAGAATSLSSVVSNLFGGGTAGGAGAMANPIASAIAAVPGLNVAIAAAAVTHVVGEGIEKLTGLRFDAAAGIFGLLPGFAVGALKGAVKGGANIGADGGALGITGSFGKKKFQDAAVSDAGSILDTISQLADALGTTVNAALGGVTIGTRNGKYRVDPTGMGNLSTGKGAIDFGKDQEAAIAYAIRDLINDGILGPISEASKRILEAGGDLEAAIKKAVLIESVPKLLKERLDPLGFALDTIDEQFQELADALREGGATAQQYADAEKLYKLEREAAIEQFGTASRTLTEYLQSLAFGSNSPLSVRQQLTAAEAAFAPFESAIRNGQTIDQDQFTAAANSLLGLSRAANASSAGYFSTYDRIRDLTSQAITNVGTSVPGEGGVVFQQQTATNTQSIARMMEDQNALLRSIDSKLANDNAVTGSTFIGSGRGFAA